MMRLGILAALATLAAVSASAMAQADSFGLQSGEVVEGRVVRGIGNAVSIKLAGPGMMQLPLSDLSWVELDMQDGTSIRGRLAGWSDGASFLETDEGMVAVHEGQIIKNAALPESLKSEGATRPTM